MQLARFVKNKNKIENVIILGEVVDYVEDVFKILHKEGLNFIKIKVYALKMLGQIYDPDSTGIDNISLTNGYVISATSNRDLKGCLVTVQKAHTGCSIREDKVLFQGVKFNFYNTFNYFKNNQDEWEIAENRIEVYVPKQENTFSLIHKLYQTNSGIKEQKEDSAYISYNPEFPTIDEQDLTLELSSQVLMDVAEKKLEEFYLQLSSLLNYRNHKNLWSLNEIKEGILRSVVPDFIVKNNLEELPTDIGSLEDTLGLYLSAVCGLGEKSLSSIARKIFKENGFDETCSLQVLLRYPYLVSFMFGGLSLSSCDRLAHLLVRMGYPVSFEGRRSIIAFMKYRSQNSTLASLEELKKLETRKELTLSKWVFPIEVEIEDNLDYKEFFEKLGSNNKMLGYISWDNLFKESFIINNLIMMKERNRRKVNKEKIKEVVARLPFELELRQLEVINNCEDGVVLVSGCAGSGKTTVAKVISEVVGGSIGYTAPTGKASRRLSEVVGAPVRTIHSLFKLGIGSQGFLSPVIVENFNSSNLPNNLIVDESAMINLDVMFRMLKKISGTSIKLIFLGDANQLQPIGNGAVFRDLSRVFNPINLEVSKRFSDNSGVGYNCKIITENGVNLHEKSDFIFSNVNISDIKRVCVSSFLKNVEEFGLGNVQIATPYVKEEKPWGSSQLNLLIQEKLFEDKEDLFLCNINNFKVYKGTKVVQSSPNIPGKPHYSWDKDKNAFISKNEEIGVFNGDVGYVVDLVPCSSVVIDNTAVREEFDDIEESKSKNSNYYLVVELNEDDYILYNCHQFRDKMVGEELYSLDLAYALTVHKLQGSEYKSIIFPIASTDNIRFVSNEMVYTAISRAKDFVMVVGDKEKVRSCLSYHKSPQIQTLMGYLRC